MATEGQPQAPSAFGRYTLLERLAVGGMAEVFRAKITSSHGFEKILVIKRILPHLAADPNFVAMFIDEAKLTAQLTHPKIVQVLDFGEVRGQYFIALEYIDGFDALGLLRVAAQKRVHMPRALAVFIVSEVLEALDYAHNARDMDGKPMQIVHRDISPSNIFISKRGDVKLGDFGIAHAQRRESKTQAGTLKGKYGYMSPEQVVGRPIDARSDLFAVGVVLAELLTGRRLFTAPADLDVLLMVRDVQLDRLDKYGADLPKALDRIVRQALKKNPRERFAERGRVPRRAGGLPVLERPARRARATCARSRARCSTPAPTRRRACCRRRAAWRRRARPPPSAAEAAARGARAPAAAAPPRRTRRRAPRRRPAPARRCSRRRRPLVADVVSDAPTAETAAARQPGQLARGREQRALVGAPGSRRSRSPATRRAGAGPLRSRLAGRPATHSDVGQVRLRRRPSARPTARATSASSRRCACSAIWRWRARRACCTSSSATP